MTYDWELYREECYRLYVEQKKSLEQVAAHMRAVHNFTPR